MQFDGSEKLYSWLKTCNVQEGCSATKHLKSKISNIFLLYFMNVHQIYIFDATTH